MRRVLFGLGSWCQNMEIFLELLSVLGKVRRGGRVGRLGGETLSKLLVVMGSFGKTLGKRLGMVASLGFGKRVGVGVVFV